MAAFDKISVITHGPLGRPKYTYAVACSTTNTKDWAYNNCRDRGPNFKYIHWSKGEIKPPGHGELEPPLNTWHTLNRDVDTDFDIDWSKVKTITIRIEHHAGYLHADRFETYFDDLILSDE